MLLELNSSRRAGARSRPHAVKLFLELGNFRLQLRRFELAQELVAVRRQVLSARPSLQLLLTRHWTRRWLRALLFVTFIFRRHNGLR
jgi:hypothetical protein